MEISEMDLTDEQLLKTYQSEFEFVLILLDNTMIETDDEYLYEQYMEADNIAYAFCLTDFETKYGLRDCLKEKGLL